MDTLFIPKSGEKSPAVPIRVMHVIDKLSVSGSGVHGITKAIERWGPRFDPNEIVFSVCSLRSPEPAGDILAQKNIPVTFLNRNKFDPRTLWDLLGLIQREQPHILHLHGYGAANFGRLASWITGIPNIVHEHAVLPHQPLYQTVVDALLSKLTTKGLAVSEAVRKFMITERKINPGTLESLAIGIPLGELQIPLPEEVAKKREELGMKTDEKVIVLVGRLDTQKGQIYLLKAAPIVLKQFPKTRFLIVGDGPDMAKLQSLAATEGISERVIFTGFRNDVAHLIAMSDILVMPSLWEGFPLTLLEAMNLKKPVIGTPVAGIEDVIQDGETGLLVPIKSTELLGISIIYLLKNPDLAAVMSEKSWQTVQQYDVSHSVNRLREIYYSLVSKISNADSPKPFTPVH